MKALARPCLSLHWLFLLAAPTQAQEYVNWVRQVQNVQRADGSLQQVELDYYVSREGTQLSEDPVPETGALFELWTINSDTGEEYLLDSTTVGAYLPSAIVNIETEDPYPNVKRTRADRPFTVRVDVDGLVADADAQEAARNVLFQQFAENYPDGQAALPNGEITSDPIWETLLEQNGQHVLSFPASALEGAVPGKVSGEEHFFIQAMQDYGVDPIVVAQDKIQIWPVTDGHFEGITDNEALNGHPTDVRMIVNDAYPGSTIYAQTYPGTPELGTDGKLIQGSHKNVTEDASASYDFQLNDWDGHFESDGVYTLEIYSESAFGRERLCHLTITIDMSMVFQGGVHSIR
ncbi:MAG: hypothetical protein Q7Q71_15580 [Verrucomicrobiota bacterium JB023]|nr:hypothetical protein [Verrucomicrobiota bacterium JB023]